MIRTAAFIEPQGMSPSDWPISSSRYSHSPSVKSSILYSCPSKANVSASWSAISFPLVCDERLIAQSPIWGLRSAYESGTRHGLVPELQATGGHATTGDEPRPASHPHGADPRSVGDRLGRSCDDESL